MKELTCEQDLGVQTTCTQKGENKESKMYDGSSMVRSQLESVVCVWYPYKDMTKIENVQRRAQKMTPERKNMTYKERLRKLNLPTLEYARQRGRGGGGPI